VGEDSSSVGGERKWGFFSCGREKKNRESQNLDSGRSEEGERGVRKGKKIIFILSAGVRGRLCFLSKRTEERLEVMAGKRVGSGKVKILSSSPCGKGGPYLISCELEGSLLVTPGGWGKQATLVRKKERQGKEDYFHGRREEGWRRLRGGGTIRGGGGGSAPHKWLYNK